MPYTKINEEELVRMYNDPNVTVKSMQKHFGISSAAVYRHLKMNGIISNRKTSIPWTEEEDAKLIEGRERLLAGSDLFETIPTRNSNSIKSRLQLLRNRKVIKQ